MKVIESIASIYNEQRVLNEKLESKVKMTMDSVKHETWFYFGRIKKLESFALKLETGRFKNAKALEDFFACTLVVENLSQIKNAISLIHKNFVLIEQRPKDLSFTHKLSYSFEFDDLRLYVKLKKSPHLIDDPLSDIQFEIQVKTFLQHAWGIATHDSIYKSDIISWSKERIGYQIKAMLEQAEMAISGVDELIKVPEVDKENYISRKLKQILKFYFSFYKKEDLPKDLSRLCKNTLDLLNALNLKVPELENIIKKENSFGRGTKSRNLSPYLVILQSIFNQQQSLFEDYINSPEERNLKIIISKEISIGSLEVKNESNVIRV